MAEQPVSEFAGLLRRLRTEARLTQEDLAQAAGLSPRTISDLERGINRTAHKDTATLLADALRLSEPARSLFVAAARGRVAAAEVQAARAGLRPARGTPAADQHGVPAADPRGTPAGARTGPGARLDEPPGPVVPRELPGTVMHFTGRAAELAALTKLADQAEGHAPGTVVISAISGTAGVGKPNLEN